MADSKQTSVRRHISDNHDYDNLKQNQAQNARTETTLKEVNQRSKDVTQTQQQRPELPTVTLTWHASKHKVHKLHQKYILCVEFMYLDLILTPLCFDHDYDHTTVVDLQNRQTIRRHISNDHDYDHTADVEFETDTRQSDATFLMTIIMTTLRLWIFKTDIKQSRNRLCSDP